jgi:large subunit ribosomal protein L31
MKKEIHPDDYRLVVFQDTSCDYSFLTRSTVQTSDTIEWEDGKEYPLYKLEISDRSHPYFTGKQNLVDSAGRIEKFNRKYKISTDEVIETAEETPASEEVPTDEVVETAEAASESEKVPAKEKKN